MPTRKTKAKSDATATGGRTCAAPVGSRTGRVLWSVDLELIVEMVNARRSKSPKPECAAFAERCAGSGSRTRWVCGLASLRLPRSRLGGGSSGSSRAAPIAACSRRPSLPTSWLTGLLFLALTSALLPGALAALLVAVPAVVALLLVDAVGSSAGAGKRDGMLAAMIGVPARHVSLASASRARSGRERSLRRPLAR
jgi:hypothetical protein